MEINIFIPIIVEATKFLFNEAGKLLDQVRKRSSPSPESSNNNSTVVLSESPLSKNASFLTHQEFEALEANPDNLIAAINISQAKTNAYEIKSLVEQIQIHRKNLVDFEKTEAEFGSLTPQHIKRGIDRESTAIYEKTTGLKTILEQVYGRIINNH